MRAALAAALFAAFSGSVSAQSATRTGWAGRLVGVYDERSGEPIDSAEVRDMMTGSFALTTSTGTLSLFFVDTAGSLIRIRKVGYAPVTMFVHNSPAEATPLTITLDAIATRLPTVTTTDSAPHYVGANLKGFEERRKKGLGYFVSEATLRKEDDRPLANTIRAHIPGVDVAERRNRTQWGSFVLSRRSAGCPVAVYLDGVPLSSKSSGNDIGQFQNNMLAAIEFYNPATVPAEFGGTSAGCGVLLLWTREK